jgi:hypothetical protein
MRMALLLAGLFLTIAPLTGAALAACGEGDVGDIDMSCQGLWHERNRVFAENGFCFQTPRGIEAFGRGCFPPYGRLSASDKCYVQAIEAIEHRLGCGL